MIKFLGILLGFIFVDFYFFPIEFTFLPPGLNSKMLLAFTGVVCFIFQILKKRALVLNSDDMQLIGLVLLISLIGHISMTYNSTPDDAYANYFISAGTWTMGAYAVILYLSSLHKDFSWKILLHYLIATCVFQCITAQWIDNSDSFSNFVDSYFRFGQEAVRDVKRLYGIGAALDVAGIRFSAILTLLFYLLTDDRSEKSNWFYFTYIVCAIIIIGLGNIIARTTTVGVILGFGYLCFGTLSQGSTLKGSFLKIWTWLITILCISVPIFIYYYHTDEGFHDNIRFAFEGFFSLVEKGTWEVDSNETLKDMYVFPETLKTWIIGDGYFSPAHNDQYYLGEIMQGFYMGTDVGYLRFIFYFGLLGLLAFSAFLIKAAIVCSKKIPHSGIVMLLLLLTNFIVWLKVSTDIYLVFALLLCLPQQMAEEDIKPLSEEV